MKSCVFNVRFIKLSLASAVFRSGSHFNDAANLQPFADQRNDAAGKSQQPDQQAIQNALGYNKPGRALYLNLHY